MFANLRKILAMLESDYADIRYECKNVTSVAFTGPELSGVGSNGTDGYLLRVLYKGGFASSAFTRLEDAAKAAAAAVANARLLSLYGRERTFLAPVPVLKGEYFPILGEDPRRVSLEEKIALLRSYNAMALGKGRIISTDLKYAETSRDRYFLSTEGTEVREELVTVSIAGNLSAGDGAVTRSLRCAIGGSDGMGRLRGREAYVDERVRLVNEMLSAKPASGGIFDVILDPALAGVFIHEAFGHLSEADWLGRMTKLRGKMVLGAQLGSAAVNIADDPTRPGQLGFYQVDDEGVPPQRVQLMKNGMLSGHLHSRHTAAVFGEAPNGHCVAADYAVAPVVRMGTIKLEPDPANNRESLLAGLGDGLYLCDMKGGQTSGDNFTFASAYGYEVKDGKPGPMVCDANIMGNLFTTLNSIAAVGDDLRLSETGGCGKDGQTNIRSCLGGPHVLIRKLVVGGAK